jgi:predicted nucleic-acid-binding Zn-ribbon protein
VKIIALHKLYQRTCKDCGYHWTVTRAQATLAVREPRFGRGAFVSSVDSADVDAQVEQVEQFRICAKCGVDFFSERPVTKRHPADAPEV